MKFHPVVAELFRADRQTGRQTTKPIVAFRNFAHAPENHCLVSHFSFLHSIAMGGICLLAETYAHTTQALLLIRSAL